VVKGRREEVQQKRRGATEEKRCNRGEEVQQRRRGATEEKRCNRGEEVQERVAASGNKELRRSAGNVQRPAACNYLLPKTLNPEP